MGRKKMKKFSKKILKTHREKSAKKAHKGRHNLDENKAGFIKATEYLSSVVIPHNKQRYKDFNEEDKKKVQCRL